jgi:hypothetical protein
MRLKAGIKLRFMSALLFGIAGFLPHNPHEQTWFHGAFPQDRMRDHTSAHDTARNHCRQWRLSPVSSATIAGLEKGELSMKSTKYVASCALLGAMTGYAIAQTTPPQSADIPPTAPTITTQPSSPSSSETTPSPTAPGTVTWYQRASDDWPASELIGSDVRNVAGETIGDVNEIILANDGNVRAVVIGVGGFLGMGERDIAVSFASLKIARDKNDQEMIVVDATRDSLSSAPLWERRRTGG